MLTSLSRYVPMKRKWCTSGSVMIIRITSSVMSSAHWRSSRKSTNGWFLQATAPISLQNMNFNRCELPKFEVTLPAELGLSLRGFPSDNSLCKFGIASISKLHPEPMASWIRQRIDMRILPALAASTRPKKAFNAEDRMVSGRVDLSNLPSTKHPSRSWRGFLI